MIKKGIQRSLRVTLCFAIIAAVAWWLLPFTVPLPEKLKQPLPVSPTFLAADGSPLRQFLNDEGQRVIQPALAPEIPQTLIHATLAAEDKRFYSHGGVDLLAIARAAWDDLRKHRVVSGASTITQQLAKVGAGQRRPRTLLTKLLEAFQARRLEMTWPKERILTEYLNRVSYGNLLTGCNSAAQGYFNKPLRDLSPAECAFLASIPQSPSRLNPYRNRTAVQKRQHRILELMSKQHWINDESKEVALQEKVSLQRFTGGFAAPHAVALAMPEEQFGTAPITTTIVPNIQSRVEGIITHRLNLLEAKHVTHAAVVVLENKTGRVLALAGSRSFFATDGGQINGAWSPHSPGSSIKPFTYLLALQHGFTTASVIPDLPIEYATPTGLYRPENYDHRNYGPVTLRTALGSSLNIPAVRALHQIGGEKVLLTALQKLGLTTLNEAPDHYGLGLTIGNAPVRLLELANAYACIARLGEAKPWTLLARADTSQSERLHPEAACYLIADILSDNQARVLTFGPRSVIRLPFRCAVKTGTSTNYRDNWTLGFMPEFTVGVWAGNFDNSPMSQVSGVSGAGPIFRDVFMFLHETLGTTWYAEPEGLEKASIDPRNGKRITDATPISRASRDELFIKGTLPKTATEADYEKDTGKALLPNEYAAWLNRGEHWLSGLVAVRNAANDHPPRIISPVEGSVFIIDPDLNSGGQRLLLRVAENMSVEWSSPSLQIETKDSLSHAILVPGTHLVTATSPETGVAATMRFEVKKPEGMKVTTTHETR